MRPNKEELGLQIRKVGKRIALTIVLSIPIVILFGYYTRNIITNSVLQILCFTLIMGIAVLIEEVIVRKREKQNKETKIERKDVFR